MFAPMIGTASRNSERTMEPSSRRGSNARRSVTSGIFNSCYPESRCYTVLEKVKALKRHIAFAEDAGEDRVDMLQVVVEIEQFLEFGFGKRAGHILVSFQQ